MTSWRISLTGRWFALGLIAVPFGDIYGLLPLGELQNELSVYIFLPLLGMVVIERTLMVRVAGEQKKPASTIFLLPTLALITLALIAFSGLANLPDLLGPSSRGRFPMEKFTSSTLVVVYGFSLAYISYHISERQPFGAVIVKPICVSIVICSAVAGLEGLAALGGLPTHIYATLSGVIHAASQMTGGRSENVADWVEIGRMRSVCREPPALADFAGSVWPWAYAGVATASRRTKGAYILVLLLCTALVAVAVSRTSAVLLLGNMAVYVLLRLLYLPLRPRHGVAMHVASIALLALGASVVAMALMNMGRFTEAIADSDYVSNITRFSLAISAIKMFFARPITGYGFGQFGFHFVQFLPAWSYKSWEIQDYVSGDSHGWPSVYSVYARFAAETGGAGVVIWTGIWLTLVYAIWRVTVAYQRMTGKLLVLSYPLIMSCVSTLLSGIGFDSVRSPIMWVTMGVGCCYVQDVRQRCTATRIILAPTDASTHGAPGG